VGFYLEAKMERDEKGVARALQCEMESNRKVLRALGH